MGRRPFREVATLSKRLLARCHKYGGRGLGLGALLGTVYHFAACLYIGLANAGERVFAEAAQLTGLDAVLGWHLSAVHLRLSGGAPPASGSEMWGHRLTAVFLAWLLITVGLALLGGLVGIIWACRPGHHHGPPSSEPIA